MKRSLKITLFCIAAAMLAFSAAVAFSGYSGAKADETTIDIIVADKADYGSEFTVRDANISFGGSEKTAQSKVLAPDGTVITDKAFAFDSYGVYTLVYYADFGGEIKSVENSITVEMPIFSMGKSTDTVTYAAPALFDKTDGQGETERLYGAFTRMSESAPATYNDVIDCNALSPDDPLVEFYIVPSDPGIETKPTANYTPAQGYNVNYKQGTRDYAAITFLLTDAYDENNYIKIYFIDADGWFFYVMSASRQNQLSGWDSDGSRLFTNGRFGTGIRLCCTNVHYSSDPTGKDWTTCYTRLYFDYAERQLFVETKGTKRCLVLDYDDSSNVSELWEGFSQGKAILTVECSQLSGGSPAQMLFTKLNGKAVSGDTAADTVDPELHIDYAGYSENALPAALVGSKYRVPAYVAADSNGTVYSSVKVYDGTGAESAITDGCFTPTAAGDYFIEYSAWDLYANKVVKTLRVNAKTVLEPIKISLKDDLDFTAKLGNYVYVSDYAVSGGTGILNVENYVIKSASGKVIIPENGRFVAEETGEYFVQFVITDYIGQRLIYHYTVTVADNDEPAFLKDALLPRYVLLGRKYVLPDLYASVYQNGAPREIKASVYVVDGGGERQITGGVWQVNGAAASQVSVIYRATANGKTAEKRYDIPAVAVSDAGGLIPQAYFVSDDMLSRATEDAVELTAVRSGDCRAYFAQAVATDDLELQFNVPGSVKFDAINIYLTDVYDQSKVLKFTYKAGVKSAVFNVNDGAAYMLDTVLGFGNSFTLTLKDVVGTVTTGAGTTVKVKSYLNGAQYEGFTQRTAYLEFEIENAIVGSALDITAINSQRFRESAKTDRIAPKVSVLGVSVALVDPGEKIIIRKAVAVDVLDPFTTITVSVFKEENGLPSYITSDDGITLNGVPSDREYEISGLPSAKYNIRYDGTDEGSSKTSYLELSVEVRDLVPPEITLSSNPSDTVKVGESITLPKATVNDDKDGAIGSAYLLVLTPKGIYETVSGEIFEFKEKGVYRFSWIAFDQAGNMGEKEYVVRAN